jgi:NAD(P)-dependent dehydrogenase (short-subunit alcohol dehydrogenase family)
MAASEPGRVVVVAGASGALGQATAARFRDDGWTVVGVARQQSLEAIPAGVVRVACDLTRTGEVVRLPDAVAEHGRWAALAVCSGGFLMGDAVTTDDAALSDQLELNLLGPWRLARVAAGAMRDGGGGRIVITLSRASVVVAPGSAAYQVTKAAAARLVEVLAAELRKDGITVNGVMPSVMDTPANRRELGEASANRWVPPAHVAAAIAWLCGDESVDVSGALVPVYGRA